jgi:subtilisin family serine protease
MGPSRVVASSRLAAFAFSALLAACAGDSATPSVADDSRAIAGPSSSVEPPTVTLLTGDRVQLRRGADGSSVAMIEPAPGRRSTSFFQHRSGSGDTESFRVIPEDAARLIATGRLDPQLFDVAALIRQRLDDAHARSLPLIVRSRDAARVTAFAGARRGRALPSIDATVVAQDKATTGALWASLTAVGTAPAALAGGIDEIWLDGLVRPVLAESAPQVGAPAAWQAGLDGAGVTVAVLDTGVDASHPDLAGRVTAAQDFTGTSPEARDDYGHGTHVASIIAGSGAAQGGLYRGVAPGASIVNGKVCVDGFCLTSDIIAGMEWAAPRARVINMSLGGGPTDGTDPLSMAVDALSAQHGTLFVISAGNSGTLERVSAPGAATRALTVASVTKADAMSDFSSRGPRFGDGALKPDIAAPGSDIVAARVPGTPMGDSDPVGDQYVRASGTSMAAPHVAAAAAILAQAHPDWSGERLKAALMTSAQPIAATIFEQGTGRLDIAHALDQPLRASAGSLGFGLLAWPHEAAAMTRTVTLTNDGDAPLALDLALHITDGQGAPAPAGMFALDVSQIALAPGASRDVTVAMQPLARTPGLFGGWLEATAGDVAVRIAVGAEQDTENYPLTLRQRWRDGAPAPSAAAYLLDTATGMLTLIDSFDADGVAVVRVPPGTYDVLANLSSFAPETARWQQAIIVEPEVMIAAPVVVELDAARAQRLSVTTDRADAVMTDAAVNIVASRSPAWWTSIVFAFADNDAFVTPTRLVTSHRFVFAAHAVLRPADPAARGRYQYDLVFRSDGSVPPVAYRARDRDLARIDARYHGQGRPAAGLRLNAVLIDDLGGLSHSTPIELALPTRRTEYVTPGEGIQWQSELFVYAPDGDGGDAVRMVRGYRPGGTQVRWNAAPLGPGFGLAEDFAGVVTWNGILIVNAGLFSPGQIGQNTSTFHDSVTGEVTVRRGDELIGHSDTPGGVGWQLPPGRARYTVEVSAQRTVPWSLLETGVDVTWSFETEPQVPAPPTALPIMVVRASGPVDGDSIAPAGVPYILTLQVEHQAGDAAVTGLELDVSYDNGAAWRRAPVVRIGRIGFALLLHPAQRGAVSLRARAADAAGTTVEQTVLGAYRIGG